MVSGCFGHQGVRTLSVAGVAGVAVFTFFVSRNLFGSSFFESDSHQDAVSRCGSYSVGDNRRFGASEWHGFAPEELGDRDWDGQAGLGVAVCL